MLKWILFDAYGTLLDAGKENISFLAQQMQEKYNISAKEIYDCWSKNYFALEGDFKEKFMSACDGHATERILDMVLNGGE